MRTDLESIDGGAGGRGGAQERRRSERRRSTRAWRRSPAVIAGAATLLLAAVALGVGIVSSDGSDDLAVVDEPDGETTATGSGGCADGALRVPTPLVTSGSTEAPMDLLHVEHRTCGYNGDGAANLGIEPPAVTVGERLRVDVSPDFDVRWALSSADDEGAPLVEGRAAGSSDALLVDVPDAGCHRLVVELVRGGLTGRFVSRLETSGGACPLDEG